MTDRSGIVALGLALAVSGCASEGTLIGTAPDGTPIYGRSFTPTPRDGAVTLSCVIGELGGLENCRVVREHPEGRGYGAMAMAMVDKSDAPMTVAGVEPGSRIEFTLRIRDD
ncbi:hypothetical protein [Brevundimonas sp.]|uniref:hypothetical protein n=1 Tax=Brevundimonas sp. TaxID=1871086 RepID=UPI003AF6624B